MGGPFDPPPPLGRSRVKACQNFKLECTERGTLSRLAALPKPLVTPSFIYTY